MNNERLNKHSVTPFVIRIAGPPDKAKVSGLLEISYSQLLSSSYDKDLLERALPSMTKANMQLLTSGTYYVAESNIDMLVGCGGWTPEKPGSKEVIPGEAHIRHFATHPEWARQGIGTELLSRCLADIKSAGLHKIYCFSTISAEPFYKASGFQTAKPMSVPMGQNIMFPAVLMQLTL